MNKAAAAILAGALAALCAAETALRFPLVTKRADGTPNVWTQGDIVEALQLVNLRYHREIATHEGRVAWHGRLVSQEIDTNALVKVDTYADGFKWTNNWVRPRPATPATALARLEAERNARAIAARRLAERADSPPPAVKAARNAAAEAAAAPPAVTNVTVNIGEQAWN